jgi:2-iminobutanoate/2-iminopropanoate deaminase
VLRTTVYLTDLASFPRMNAVYASCFTKQPPPARSTVGVAALPLGVRVEIDAIATVAER